MQHFSQKISWNATNDKIECDPLFHKSHLILVYTPKTKTVNKLLVVSCWIREKMMMRYIIKPKPLWNYVCGLKWIETKMK